MEEVKTIVWRYTFAYYNTKCVTTVNPNAYLHWYTGKQQLKKVLLKYIWDV